MIANLSKFHAIILKKDQTDASGTSLSVKDHVPSTETEVNLLGITIDYRVSFDTHIGNLCKKAARQINALKRLSSFLNQSSKHIMVNFFIIANFNYCPLIWHFCSAKNIQRVEKIQERALRFVYSDYTSTYPQLLEKSSSCTVEVKCLRAICLEVYKSINNIGPNCIKNLFSQQQSAYSARRPMDLCVPRINQTTFGLKSFRYEAVKQWNSLPENVKCSTDLQIFKRLIKTWDGPACHCNFCMSAGS